MLGNKRTLSAESPEYAAGLDPSITEQPPTELNGRIKWTRLVYTYAWKSTSTESTPI